MKSNTERLSVLLSASLLAAWPALAQHQAAAPGGDPHHSRQGEAPAAAPHEGGAGEATNAGADKPAMLGVAVERISEELRHQLPAIKPGAGLIVRQLMPGSPAAQAHVEKLDILLMWNDQSLVHPAQLQVLAQSSKPGDQVDLQFLHRGAVTRSRVTLAEQTAAPAKGGDGHHHPTHDAGGAPAAQLGALLGSDLVREAADALAKSGIDANAVAGMLMGADLGKLDPGKLDPAILLGGKLALIGPDGSRREINLADVLKANGNLGEVLKGLDLGKTDPAALLGSKILLIGPDGTQKEINLADVLKSSAALNELLKGLGQPPAR